MSKKHKATAPKAAPPKARAKLADAVELARPVAADQPADTVATQAHCVRADLAALQARVGKTAGKNKSDRAFADALARLDEGWQALFRRREEG